MFSNVTVNSELAHTKLLLLGETQGGFWSQQFLSADQYINLFYVCFWVKTPYLIYAVDSLTLNSLPSGANSTITHS